MSPDANGTLPAALVVSAEAATRELLRCCLDELGVRWQACSTLDEAETRVGSQHPPDLIILDLAGVGDAGLTFCSRLRGRSPACEVPVLVVPGGEDDASLDTAYDAGATDFVARPLVPAILRNRIRYLLRSGQAVRELRDSRTTLATAQRIAQLGNWSFDSRTGTFHWTDEALEILGLESGSTPDFNAILAAVEPLDRAALREAFDRSLDGGESRSTQYRLVGEPVRHVHQRAEVQHDAAGQESRVVFTVQDVTERRAAEEQIRFLAYRDVLTGLPNRRLYGDRLERSVVLARRGDRHVAVLHLDIDRFKAINDGFGHRVGDALLQRIATRIEGCLRSGDTVARASDGDDPVLSRLGGDEFIVVLSDVGTTFEPGHVATRVLEELSRPFRIGETELFVTASAGIAVFPDDGDSAETLSRRAETALGHAKDQGGNCYLFYSGRMNTDAAARLDLATRLHHGLEEQQFDLVYQPIFDVATQHVRGVEALLRWNHPEDGLVLPGTFIPVAEETGLILPLGEWVIDRACRQWREWFDGGAGAVEISVNVSARQFHDPEFVRRVAAITGVYGVDPRYLRMEITEGVLMSSAHATVDTTRALREMGVGLSVDDFGTGYSSLNYLRRFPADLLKIDRSFVRGVPEDRENCSLVSAIVAMAHKLRLRVVAEGVETEGQLRFLGALDCEEVQGFLLGRPAHPQDIAALLRGRLDRSAPGALVPFRRRAS